MKLSAYGADLQELLDSSSISARGEILKVGLEPDRERTALLTAYFNGVRAMEQAATNDVTHFKIELATFTLYHSKLQLPIFKFDRNNHTPIFHEATLDMLTIREDEIRARLS